jgi:hypothetical protein
MPCVLSGWRQSHSLHAQRVMWPANERVDRYLWCLRLILQSHATSTNSTMYYYRVAPNASSWENAILLYIFRNASAHLSPDCSRYIYHHDFIHFFTAREIFTTLSLKVDVKDKIHITVWKGWKVRFKNLTFENKSKMELTLILKTRLATKFFLLTDSLKFWSLVDFLVFS